MKFRLRYLLYISVITLLFTGCSDMTQIEDRDFVLAVGVGYDQGEYKLTYARPDLSVLTGQPAQQNEKLIVTYTGSRIPDIEDDYARNSNKRLDYNHLKAIVLDYSIVENKLKMNEFFDYIENNYEISRNTLVFYTNEQANKILEVKTISGNIGENLEQLYENNPHNSDTKKVTIGDLVNGLYQIDKVLLIPNLEIKEDRIWLSGAAIFSENEYVDSIDEDLLTYVYMMTGVGKGRNIMIENTQVVNIKEIKSKYTFSLKDGKPNVVIKIKGVGKGLQSKASGDSEIILNTHLKETMIYIYQDLMKDKKVDYLNLYRRLSYKDRDTWRHYKGNVDRFIDDLTVDFVVDFTLQ